MITVVQLLTDGDCIMATENYHKLAIAPMNSPFQWTKTDNGDKFSLSCNVNGEKLYIIGTPRDKLKLKPENQMKKLTKDYGYDCELFKLIPTDNGIRGLGDLEIHSGNAGGFMIEQIQKNPEAKYIGKDNTRPKPILTENIIHALTFEVKLSSELALNEERDEKDLVDQP